MQCKEYIQPLYLQQYLFSEVLRRIVMQAPDLVEAQILVEALKTDSGCLENKMRKCVRTELYSEVII